MCLAWQEPFPRRALHVVGRGAQVSCRNHGELGRERRDADYRSCTYVTNLLQGAGPVSRGCSPIDRSRDPTPYSGSRELGASASRLFTDALDRSPPVYALVAIPAVISALALGTLGVVRRRELLGELRRRYDRSEIVPVLADLYLLTAQGRPPHRLQDLGGCGRRHFHEREPVPDLDRAELGRIDARFVGNRADQISRPDAGFAPGADEQTYRIAAVSIRTAEAWRARLLLAAFDHGWSAVELLGVVGTPERRMGQLHSGGGDVQDIELLGERLHHYADVVEIPLE